MLLHKQQHNPESANLLYPMVTNFPSPYVTVNQRPRIHKAVGYEQEQGALQMFVPNGVYLSRTGKKLLHVDSSDSCVFAT